METETIERGEQEEAVTLQRVKTRATLESQLADAKAWREQFTHAAWQLGDDRNLCDTFDALITSLDMPRRPRQWTVTYVRGVERPNPDVIAQHASVVVRAQSQEEANTLAAEQVANHPDSITWHNARTGDHRAYLPELSDNNPADHPSTAEGMTVVIPPRPYGNGAY